MFTSIQYRIISFYFTFSSVFIVLMPLNTTFDQKQQKVRHFSRVCSIKLRGVMSVFVSPVASSDRAVMILIFLESVESQLANRYLVCADPISNKGILT